MSKVKKYSFLLLIITIMCIIIAPTKAKALDLKSPTITKFQASSDEANALVVNWVNESTDKKYIVELYNSTTGTYNRFSNSITEYTYQKLESSKDYRIAIRTCIKEDCTEWSEAKEARTYDGAVNFKDNSAIINSELDNKNLTNDEKKSAEEIKEGYTNNNENKTAQEEAIKNGEGAETKDVIIATTNISFNKQSTTLLEGETETLVSTIEPANTTDSIIWSSSDEKIATVENGVIKAVKQGTATIKATSGSKTATCTVEVKANATSSNSASQSANAGTYDEGYINQNTNPTGSNASVSQANTTTNSEAKNSISKETIIPIKSIKANKSTFDLTKGNSYQISTTISPANTTQTKALTYSSSNKNIATVNSTGKIVGIKAGTATITITSKANPNIKTNIKVIVKEFPIASIKIKLKYYIIGGPDLTLKKGKTHNLSVLFNPTYTTDAKTIKWTSSNTKVATINSAGKITAKSKGKTTITATATGAKKAKTAKIKVEVTEKPIKKVTLNKTKLSAKWDGYETFGCDVTLKATISPSDTTDSKTITWTSSNKKVATVNKNGCVVYHGAGTATITAKAGSKKDTCKITITKKKSSKKTPKGQGIEF